MQNVLLCDVVHRLRQGVLYFKSVIWLHSKCINVIFFVLVRTVWPSLRRYFTKRTNDQQYLYYMELHSNQRINAGSMYTNLCMPINKIMAVTVPIFTKLDINQYILEDTSFKKFLLKWDIKCRKESTKLHQYRNI